LAFVLALVSSRASSRNGFGLLRNVVHDIPLMGNGAPAFSRSSASECGCVNGRRLGSTPPAMTAPSTFGGGNVKGRFVMTSGTPAAARSPSIVFSLIDRYVTGRLRRSPSSFSKMSYTPWLDGSTPVRNEGQAAQEWFGTVDRRTPLAPR
jgi:hypothetical protein